ISILDQRGCSLFLRPKASTSTLSHGHKLSHGKARRGDQQPSSARTGSCRRPIWLKRGTSQSNCSLLAFQGRQLRPLMSRVEVQDEEEVEGSEELQEKRVGLYALFSFHVEEHGTWRRVNWQLPAIAL
ncbi:unnamed protein product, partial [Ascophyllum nodosum]